MGDYIISRSDDAYSHTYDLKLFSDDGFVMWAFEDFFTHKKCESFLDSGDHVGCAIIFGTFVILIGEIFCEVGNSRFFFGRVDILSGKSCLDTVVIIIDVCAFPVTGLKSFVRCCVDFG